MRHAKAEQTGRTDHERELTVRGRADAAESGRWLADRGFAADGALVSAATRTRQTWDELASAAAYEVVPDLSEALYSADEDSALDLLRRVDDAIVSLVVVGHNPTMAYLAADLDDGTSEHSNALVLGFPTAACAVFEYVGSWAELFAGGCRLVDFSSPAARG